MLLCQLLKTGLMILLHVDDDVSFLAPKTSFHIVQLLLKLLELLNSILLFTSMPLLLFVLLNLRLALTFLQLLIFHLQFMHFGLQQINALFLLCHHHFQLLLLGLVLNFQFANPLLRFDEGRSKRLDFRNHLRPLGYALARSNSS